MFGTPHERVAVVTGGARGLGLACATRFAAEGSSLVLIDVDEETLAATADAFTNAGTQCLAAVADVADEDQIAAARDRALSEFGSVDILVNNAGRGAVASVLEMSVEEWDAVLDCCLKGTFICTKVFGRPMIEGGGGAIVNVSSMMALNAAPTRSAYSAAKAAVIALTQVSAGELARYGVRVNAVAPGYLDTPAVRSAIEAGFQVPEDIFARTPLRRMGDPAEIAALVSYLVSPDAAFITGAVFVADGGYTAYGAWWPTDELAPGTA